MRRLSYPKILLALLLPVSAGAAAIALVGCVVSVPKAQRTLRGDARRGVRVTSTDCPASPDLRLRPVATTGLDGERFRLLTWNVHRGDGAGWLGDFVRLARDHDVLALQEAYLTADLHDALGDQDYDWRLSASFRLRDIDAGVLTAARTPVEGSCSLRYGEPFTRIPKAALTTVLHIAGSDKPLLMANLHGVNFTLGTTDFQSQLNAVAARLVAHDGPLILAGDFNTWSVSRRRVLDSVAERLGLRSVEPADDRRTRFFGHTVDGVYYRGLEVVDTTTYAVTSSDHNPMSVTFRMPRTLLARAS